MFIRTALATALRFGPKCGCPLLGSDRDKPYPYALQLYINARWTRIPLWRDFARLMSPSPPRSDATELRKADVRSFANSYYRSIKDHISTRSQLPGEPSWYHVHIQFPQRNRPIYRQRASPPRLHRSTSWLSCLLLPIPGFQ